MKKYFAIIAIATLIISSCKKDKNIEEIITTPIPLNKAILGKWIEVNGLTEYHFLNDTNAIFKINAFQPQFICNAKYSINKDIYVETLGYLQIVGIPGQCNTTDLLNLKILEINDSTFTASRSSYTGNPPNYFIDVEKKYRKFQ